MIPTVTLAVVVQQVPDRGGLLAALRASMQVPFFTRMSYHGAADALRLHQAPMPSVGSWILVAFPNGDVRNAIYLCTVLPNGQDALTSTTSGTGTLPADPHLDYLAHWSGFARLLDGAGQLGVQWPDGSTLYVGSGAFPTFYRHTIDGQQIRVKVPSTLADRAPTTPAPFPVSFAHAAGATFSVSTSGSVTLSAASGQVATLVANGSVVQVRADGTISLAASGGNATLTMTPAGNMTVQVQNLTINVENNATVIAQGRLALYGNPITEN